MGADRMRNIKDILVFCLPGIGDTLLFTPAFRALKTALPDCHISALTMFAGARDVLRLIPWVDEILHFDFLHAGLFPSLRFVRQLRKRRFDASIFAYPANRLEYNLMALFIGARYVNGISIVNWPLNRLIVSRLGTAYAKLLTGLPITDCTSGFKCYRADVLRAIDLKALRSNGYVFQVETSFRAWRLGYRLKDLPIIFYERKAGQSKLHLNIAFEALRVVAALGVERLFRNVGIRV